jgi:hypothetical protein
MLLGADRSPLMTSTATCQRYARCSPTSPVSASRAAAIGTKPTRTTAFAVQTTDCGPACLASPRDSESPRQDRRPRKQRPGPSVAHAIGDRRSTALLLRTQERPSTRRRPDGWITPIPVTLPGRPLCTRRGREHARRDVIALTTEQQRTRGAGWLLSFVHSGHVVRARSRYCSYWRPTAEDQNRTRLASGSRSKCRGISPSTGRWSALDLL